MDKIWPSYQLKYNENGREKTMEVTMTFADFAITEARFRKHFRQVPRDAWNENMMPLAEFLELPEEERADKFPYIWAVDRKQKLNRVMVAKPIVESCEERRDFWIMLRDLAGIEVNKPNEVDLENKIRAEVVGKIAEGLMNLAGGNGQGLLNLTSGNGNGKPSEPANGNGMSIADFMAAWIETDECTSCDECTKINPNIFQYNTDKKAFIKDPKGGPYQDIVKAAEKCTAGVIHPGLPGNSGEKDLDKWIQRAKKFN
jgi:pyruvate-ferredoxin/flavodoxin oxidoreductase